MALTLTCPICGPRNGYEFRYGGEDKGAPPDTAALDPFQWVDYVHLNNCSPVVKKEWWFHRDGCAIWFTLYRDTSRNVEITREGKVL